MSVSQQLVRQRAKGDRKIERIILASASPRRVELMRLLGLDFEVVEPEVEEILPQRSAVPGLVAEKAAEQKATSVAEKNLGALVIGADTVVVVGNQILGKPKDACEAEEMLCLLRGRIHTVITGLALVGARLACGSFKKPGEPGCGHKYKKRVQVSSVSTQVMVADITLSQIKSYVETGEPFGKAGAYAIQGRFAPFISRIEGDYYNVVGLPLHRLMLMLEGFGVEVMGDNGNG